MNPASKQKEGAALLVALWIIIILALITGSFAFEMKLEAMLVSYQRKRFQAETMAYSGIEYAKALLEAVTRAKELEVEDLQESGGDEDGFMSAALMIQQGGGANLTKAFTNGTFTVEISSAESGLNANRLTPDEWKNLFEMAGIPNTDWDEMIDCLIDWMDDNDLSQLNGAESDDSFYETRGYPVKNGPLDSIEELLLVKGWGEEILYGKPADADSDGIIGIADMLTVWGNGQINLNTTTPEVMEAAGMLPEEIASVLEDLEFYALENKALPADYAISGGKFKLKSEYLKVTSTGDVHGTKYQITCILLSKGKEAVPVYWEEGPVK